MWHPRKVTPGDYDECPEMPGRAHTETYFGSRYVELPALYVTERQPPRRVVLCVIRRCQACGKETPIERYRPGAS